MRSRQTARPAEAVGRKLRIVAIGEDSPRHDFGGQSLRIFSLRCGNGIRSNDTVHADTECSLQGSSGSARALIHSRIKHQESDRTRQLVALALIPVLLFIDRLRSD